MEKKVEEKKQLHENYLKKHPVKDGKKDELPSSYLRDDVALKKKAESEGSKLKAVNKSALVVEPPKPITNQKVIKHGIRHSESEIIIEKPSKKTPQASQETRSKTESDVVENKNPRSRGTKPTGLSRAAQNAARKGSDIYNKQVVKQQKKEAKKKEMEDVYNLPDFPNQNDDSSDEDKYKSMNKPAMQLVAELRAKSDASKSSNSEVNKLINQKMVIPKQSPNTGASSNMGSKAVSGGSQVKLSDADLDDLLSGKKPAQKQIDDDEFDMLLSSKPKKPTYYEEAKNNELSSFEPVEPQWKIGEESKQDDDHEYDYESSDEEIEDVDAAFNFTDTEFDANNRDDFDMDTEMMANYANTLGSIAEVDEESEQTIQRKRNDSEIRTYEKRIKEMESGQKQKWSHIVQYSDEKVAKDWFEFAAKKFDQLDDDAMEEITSEIQSFIYAHGVDQYENMAFELFLYIIKESDIRQLKEELDVAKENSKLI